MTLEQALASGGRLYLDARIEGVAPAAAGDAPDGDARVRICVDRPAYATSVTDAHWQPVLAAWPDLMSESLDVFGGLPNALGRCTLQVLDHRDWLTQLHQPAARPLTVLAEDLDATETAVDVVDGSVIVAPRLIFVGSECMRVTAVASNTLTVTRGWAGTDAVTHTSNDRVFGALRNLLGRRMEVRLGPAIEADEQAVGEYVVERVDWTEATNVWTVSGRSQMRYLDRAVPRVVQQCRVTGTEPGSRALFVEPDGSGQPGAAVLPYHWPHNSPESIGGEPPTSCYGVLGDEELALNPQFLRIITVPTGPMPTVESPMLLRRVLVPDITKPASDFQRTYGPTGASVSGDTDQWADVLAQVVTSPSDAAFAPGDNDDANYGNWSNLPTGFGLGLPMSVFDGSSILAAVARTFDFRVPHFRLGAERQAGPDVLNELLRPMGASLVPIAFPGDPTRLSLQMPRAPLLDETITTEITIDDLVSVPQASYTGELQTKSVTYSMGPDRTPITFSDADYDTLWGQRNYYVDDGQIAEIEVPGGDPGHRSVWGARAASMLWRLHRPHVLLSLEVLGDVAWTALLGSYVRVTLPELPDGIGGRGWTSVLATVLQRELSIEDGALTGTLRLLCYDPDERMGAVAPTARIASGYVSGDTFPVEENRFIAEDASLVLGLPGSDATAFNVGDVVRLVDGTGASLSGTAQTITDINVNELVLDGDFGGAASGGDLIIWTDYVGASAAQRLGAAYAADADGLEVDGAEPYVFAES